MNCLVTGAAGFIGSHLCRKLLNEGYSVTGIDSFVDFYPKWIKEKNIIDLKKRNKFKFISEDINNTDLGSLLKKTDFVLHLAAQAGVRSSWGSDFSVYTKNNIEATQKLLEAAKNSPVKKFIYASSSSVYGAYSELPMSEKNSLHPYSPYGVTKLAGENLCSLYFNNFGIHTVSLRFFTVYGPGQRPDMAFHRFFKAIINDKQIPVFGNGKQTRDFTYIDDIIKATFSSIVKGRIGEIYNIAGGNRRKLEDIFPIIEKITLKNIQIKLEREQKGDVSHTYADIGKAKKDLNFSPQTPLTEGLQEEWSWIQKLYSS